jgi:hypothetical protein
MPESEPRARQTLALVLGASTFRRAPKLAQGRAFYDSAQDFYEYLISADGLGLSQENVDWHFDDSKSPSDQLQEIRDFIESRSAALRQEGAQPQDLIVYYVGHGLFSGADNAYCLAIRETDERNEGLTSIRASDLASIIKTAARFLRKFLILDCCFSATAYREFQSGPLTVGRVKILDELPQKGTTLLCSASARDQSIAPQGLSRTMFSDSLLRALRQGHPDLDARMSLSELGDLVKRNIREAYPSSWVRPEVHSPDQREGDIASVPLFPNAAFSVQRKPRVVEHAARGEPAAHIGELSADHSASDAEAWVDLNESSIKPLPFPQARGGVEPILALSDVLGFDGLSVREIENRGSIVFQAAGSTGSRAGTPVVADRMEKDFREHAGIPAPTFLFLLGDVVCDFGEPRSYYSQFFLPYAQYPAPILAIAGNHDAMVAPGAREPLLHGFLDNFCAAHPHQTSASGGLGRNAQIQPGVYFTLEAPFLRIVALYSNASFGPGVISHDEIGSAQLGFVEAALRRARLEEFAGAIMLAVHHDPYGPGERVGSSRMRADLDAVFRRTGNWPHAVVSGHAHIYERYMRAVDGMQIPYVVAGNGGFGVTKLRHPASTPMNLSTEDEAVTLVALDDQSLGFLRVVVDKRQLHMEYHSVSSHIPYDEVTVDLKTRRLVGN